MFIRRCQEAPTHVILNLIIYSGVPICSPHLGNRTWRTGLVGYLTGLCSRSSLGFTVAAANNCNRIQRVFLANRILPLGAYCNCLFPLNAHLQSYAAVN